MPPAPAAAQLQSQSPPVVADEVVAWPDDLNHFVVTTAIVPANPALAAGPDVIVIVPGTEAVAEAPPVGGTEQAREAAAPSDRIASAKVSYTDGRIEVLENIPAGGFRVVSPRDTSQAGVDISTVVDDDGVLGIPGAQYVRTHDAFVQLADPLADLAAPITTAPSDPAAPVTTDHSDDDVTFEFSGDDTPDLVVTGDEAVAEALRAVPGVERVEVVGPGIVQVATSTTAEVLRDVPGVGSVEVDALLGFSGDTRQNEQWVLDNTGASSQAGGWPGVVGADINAPEAWGVSTGAGVVVAVIDSGVESDHPDLSARMWNNPGQVCGSGDTDGNGFSGDCHGWDFGSNDSNTNPDAGAPKTEHGTHVAGIVAASRNGVGVVGVAPEATIMALKVSNTAGSMSTSSVAAAINYAVAEGADVVNLSLGTTPGGYTRDQMSVFEVAIANARTNGVVVAVAMGNSSVDITNSPVWPASFSLYYDNVISVGATTNSDTRASFSNTGSPLTIYAPGWWMLSTVTGSGWGLMSGTSMAAPAIAGSAALVISANPTATPAAVRSQLVATATPLAIGGRVNVAAALGVAPGAGVSVEVTGADTLRPDSPGTLDMTVVANGIGTPASMRVSVGARVGGTVHAVEGLAATFTDALGTLQSSTTDASGAFANLPVRSPQDLASGAGFSSLLTLPAGEFALVSELLDAASNPLGNAQVTYLSVSESGSTSSTVPPATTTPSTGTTAPAPPPATGPPGGTTAPTTPTTAVAPATTTQAGGTTAPTTITSPPTLPRATPPTLPRVTTPTTNPGGGTVSPPPPPSTSTPTPTPTPTTTPMTGTTAPKTPSGGGSPAPTTSAPTAPPAPSTPVTTPVVTTPAGGTTGPTTPAPDPAVDGEYSASAVSPRVAPSTGGTAVRIEGHFPTNVRVYVWFGDSTVEAVANATYLTVTSPAVQSSGVADVSVRFTTSRTVRLTLTGAFTFTAPTVPTTPSTSSPPATAPATTTPRSGTTPATLPATPPATTSPGGGTATTAPATPPVTTAPGGGPATSAPSAVVRPPTGTLGSLTLHAPTTSSALIRLNVGNWPQPGCRAGRCAASTL